MKNLIVLFMISKTVSKSNGFEKFASMMINQPKNLKVQNKRRKYNFFRNQGFAFFTSS